MKVYRIYSKVKEEYYPIDANGNEFTRDIEDVRKIMDLVKRYIEKYKLVIQEFELTNEKEIV